MQRRPSPPASPHPRNALLAVTLAILVTLAPPAHGGIGGAVKSLKDKAGKAAAQKGAEKAGGKAGQAPAPDEAPPEFGGNLLELTSDRLDQVLKGLKAGEEAKRPRADVIARRQKVEAELTSVNDKFSEAIDEANRKRNDAENCYSDALQDIGKRRNKELEQKMMSDPALYQKYMAMAQRLGMAQASGDTATVSKLQEEMLALSRPTRADTVAAQQKCGPLPARHPMAARLEALQHQATSFDDELRAIDEKSNESQAKASGMTARQFAMARERIEMYLASVRGNAPPRGFGANELSALASHRSALEAALGAS